MENTPEFYSRPKTYYELVVDMRGEELRLNPQNCCIFRYRYAPEYDHLIYEDSKGNKVPYYDCWELLDWMSGVHFGEDGRPMMVINTDGKNMYDLNGWLAPTAYLDFPSLQDKALYETHELEDFYSEEELTADDFINLTRHDADDGA